MPDFARCDFVLRVFEITGMMVRHFRYTDGVMIYCRFIIDKTVGSSNTRKVVRKSPLNANVDSKIL